MPSRIEDLERRVRQDPSSIAFGALAEEYRRAGRLEEAIAVCRSGLERHPSYLSARVTLGRTLQEIGDVAEARAEYDYVLSLAPDNLAAIRGLAELGDDGAAASVAPSPVSNRFEAPARAPDPLEARVEPVTPPPEPVAQPSEPPQPPASLSEPASTASESPEPEPVWSQAPVLEAGEPDFAALDASIERVDAASAASAARTAQIERLEIWLAKIEQARDAGRHRE